MATGIMSEKEMRRVTTHNPQLPRSSVASACEIVVWRMRARAETSDQFYEATHRSGLPPRCLYAMRTLAQSCSKK
jgi:hypothetical protein